MAPASSLVNKIKVQLKLSISRLRMVQQKDEALAKQARRAMAQLLEQGKEESAKIRVENIIRSDMNTELLEILELYCELLIARAGLMEAKECDSGLEEAVKSIIYAAPKIEGVKELSTVRQLLAEKYGKDFTLAAMEGDKVSDRVKSKTSTEPPKQQLVHDYLSIIADTYDVDWPKGIKEKRAAEAAAKQEQDDDEDDDDDGGRKNAALEVPQSADALSTATPPRDFGPKSPVSVMPPSPSTDNVRPKVNLAGPGELKPSQKMVDANKSSKVNDVVKDGPGGSVPTADDLAKRFAQLKR